jgi:TPR repeat protein
LCRPPSPPPLPSTDELDSLRQQIGQLQEPKCNALLEKYVQGDFSAIQKLTRKFYRRYASHLPRQVPLQLLEKCLQIAQYKKEPHQSRYMMDLKTILRLADFYRSQWKNSQPREYGLLEKAISSLESYKKEMAYSDSENLKFHRWLGSLYLTASKYCKSTEKPAMVQKAVDSFRVTIERESLYKKTFRKYEMASRELNTPEALIRLGVTYWEKGCRDQGVSILREQAKQGNVKAMLLLGEYLLGYGSNPPEKMNEGVHWYEQAFNAGDHFDADRVAKILIKFFLEFDWETLRVRDAEKGVFWAKKLAESSSDNDVYYAGVADILHNGVLGDVSMVNLNEAAQYYLRSFELHFVCLDDFKQAYTMVQKHPEQIDAEIKTKIEEYAARVEHKYGRIWE